ncbi:HD domain-containing phosphohydrolase [Magnetospira sp. QH-2]|uniref:HD domain-containing phosphohydrolase n=1 Tax=Magnetospira sp. (strain QH-2) TaxID=1288970 RepID=UPI0003E8154C|nr:HD domain-containing phosphohydrolase [Magnetospira sp. QH-2]CCQ74849.1 putative metal dependent phosphohydrolase with GAF sensor domain [Magnetospira sp. QH-2]
MAEELFRADHDALERAKHILEETVADKDHLRSELTTLCHSYEKLTKVAERLVRLSDRSSSSLFKDNKKLVAAQADLAELNSTLAQHIIDHKAELDQEQAKLAKLVELGIGLSAEKDVSHLMELILIGAKDLTNADGGTLYIRTDDDHLSFEIMRTDSLDIAMGGSTGKDIPLPPVAMFNADSGEGNHHNVVSHSVLTETTVNITDAYEDDRFDFSGTKAFDEKIGYRSTSFLTVPLKPRGGDVIGALQLLNAQDPTGERVIPFSENVVDFVEALAAQAAVALDNRNLVEAQRVLLDSFIQLIAGAIDAKSPYTGGHCARVPELSAKLVKAASDANHGPFADFQLDTDDEWREFHIAAWLHDCGKVTTPEYVVDKATKLETIYNRIHEVRTRFEVLRRDAEIAYLNARLEGTRDEADLKAEYEAELARLEDDFIFVAESNVGGEFMAPEKVERLNGIAARTWTRHFDDRLGLSQGERDRCADHAPTPVPAEEKLLGDKPEHIVPRPNRDNPFDGDNPFGFQIDMPEALYNYGELYNLSIGRGTLTAEERYKINEHIVQTIMMLERLPFPKQLRRIPEYAGAHHETMLGTGYPRKLTKEDMSIPARIMAIADIFEALTATDRPYKAPKTLSEAIRILSFFKKDQHIDGDLFDLFLSSGVYKEYASEFMTPEQIDEVDISQYLSAEQAER